MYEILEALSVPPNDPPAPDALPALLVALAFGFRGFSSSSRVEVAAVSANGAITGRIAAGALDPQLRALAAADDTGRLLDLEVNEAQASSVGLSCGGTAQVALLPAAALPGQLLTVLQRREPVCLVAPVSNNRIGSTTVFTHDTIADAGPEIAHVFLSGRSDAALIDGQLVCVFWPVPRLVVVGAGAVADAVAAAVALLGWPTQVLTESAEATTAIAQLSAVDNVVVISHQAELYGPALLAALGSPVGYLGALGSRRTQRARAEWLQEHGVAEHDHARIHGPAGLNLGANTPAEIAVSIVAEILASRAGANAVSLSQHAGPIHDRPAAAWPHAR